MSKRQIKTAVIYTGKATPPHSSEAYNHILNILKDNGAEIKIGGGVADCLQAEKTVCELMCTEPDVLLIVVLSGRSATMIEAAGKASTVPVVIWAVGSNFSFPSSTLAGGVLKEIGCRFKIIHGEPENEKTVSGLFDALSVAYAISGLKRLKIGLVGGLFFNLVSCRYDPDFLREKFGVRFRTVEYEEIQNLMNSTINSNELLRLEKLCCSFDMRVPVESLTLGLKLHMALAFLAKKEKIDAYALECWIGLPEKLTLNPCLGFIEDAYIIACEGDAILSIMLFILKCMVGYIPFVADIQNLDEDNILTICHCGASASLAENGDVILDKSAIAEEQGFTAITCRPNLRKGPVTLVRLGGSKCDRMHVVSGELTALNRSGSYTASIKLTGSRDAFIEECSGNHYIVVHGDIRNKIRLFGKWMGILVVET